MYGLVDADVKHGKRLTSRADQQRPLAAELFSKGHQTNGSDHDLNNAVNPGGKESGGATSKTDLLENLGCIIIDRVSSGPLLPKHEDDSEGGAVEDLLIRASRLELSNHRHFLVAIEVSNDVVEFLNNIWVLSRLAPDVSKCLSSVGDAVLLNKPTRTLVHENNAGQKDHTREHLQGKGHTPLGGVVAAGDIEIDAVVDEERQTNTGDVEQLHATNTSSSNLLRCVLRDVGWYNS